ncbi:hypothetical protein BIW11_05846 [Tropilaelaps mercedesae]|uniref:Uncharacterized protein n=1 Tax=Tropilaelaps mercedesae TaxID=418985 RepID=A0A1V9Y0R2_9ACAR|nr:hypothetical protein BIW11_05846 [Tropilaelaps mercedesae]
MFEKDILSSLKLMLDHAKGDRKISSEVTVVGYSPKRSRDIIAPSYENVINNTCEKNNGNFKIVFGSLPHDSSRCPPLSRTKEIRTEVTPDLLAKILKSTVKAKQINPTQELALHGKHADAWAMNCPSVTSTNIKKLKSSCPSMKTLQLQNLNLRAKQKSHRIRLVDFPSNIERVSLRSSSFEPKSFFSKMIKASSKDQPHKLDKLRVLDVGRAMFLEGKTDTEDPNFAPERLWPSIESLEELYLEGAPHLESTNFLEALLKKFPNLNVLDLEGTDVNDSDLVMIARHAPNLRELYLGYTSVKDSSIIGLEITRASGSAGSCLDKLEVICLSETAVTDLGLASLVRTCQSLRSITVKRSKVCEEAAKRVKQILPGLSVNRVENTHIYAVFRNQGCAHFSLKYDLTATAPPATMPTATVSEKPIVSH